MVSRKILLNKRSGAFSPVSIRTLKAWYDTSDDAYLTLVGSAITQFLDRSGRGNHTNVQGTTTRRPTRSLDQINGLQAATFDGGDVLDLPSTLFSLPNNDNTIIIVAKQATVSGNLERFINMSEGSSGRYNLGYATTSGNVAWASNAGGSGVTSRGVTTTQFNMFSCFREGATLSISTAGGDANTSANGADEDGIDSGQIGAERTANYVTGAISEILMFDSKLTAEDFLQVEIYLANKWGLYHPNATWINEFDADQRAMIHAAKLNKDNSMIEIASLIEGWFDYTNERFLTLSSSAITQALDKSGKGYDGIVQATGTARPTFTANRQNGLPSAVFDGGDWLGMNTNFYSLADQDSTIFVACKRATDSGNSERIYQFSDGATLVNFIGFSPVSERMFYKNRLTGSGDVTKNGITTTDPNIYYGRHSSTTGQALSLNGDTETTNSNGEDVDSVDTFRVGSDQGGGNNLTGDIYEMVVCNASLSAAQIDIVLGMLSNKLNITVS